MDIAYLLRILSRRKWLIFSVMGAAALATFLLIAGKPEKYRATVILSTGIVNYKGLNSDNSDAFVQQYQVENAFSNLIEFTQSRSSIKLLSIHMLQHDLSAGQNGRTAFRKRNDGLSKVSEQEVAELAGALAKIRLDSISDPAFSQQLDYLIDKVARAYGYDHDALKGALSVKRKASTDYLTIDFVTENPQLSQFLANEYGRIFIQYYTNLALREKKKSVESFAKLVSEKSFGVDTIKAKRFNYLRQRGLPAIGKQSEDIVMQIADYEKAKQEAQAKINASGESLAKIDKYIKDRSSRDAGEVQNRVASKNTADEHMERVRELTRRSIETGGKDADVEAELTEAKAHLEEAVRSGARNIGRPKQNDESRRTKEDLYKDRVAYDLDRIEAEKTVDQLGDKIASLRYNLKSIVADDEYAQGLVADEIRASEELDAVNKDYIKAKLSLEDYECPLSIIENAQLPEWPEPNRQVMLSVFAAIVAGTMTCIALFLLAFMDNTLQSPDLFKKYTNNLPFLGAVNAVSIKGLDLDKIFSSNGEMPQYTAFREGLRKIRTQMVNSGAKTWLFVSTKPAEGKTFTMLALAHSLAFNNKRVLLIDTNFKTPLPETFTDRETPNAVLLNRAIEQAGLTGVFQQKSRTDVKADPQHKIDIIGNTGVHQSPSELFEREQFAGFLTELGNYYDFIFLESAPLNQYSDANELEPYSDKVISVFNAKSVIRPTDKDSIEYLRNMSGKFAGAILTEVDARNLN